MTDRTTASQLEHDLLGGERRYTRDDIAGKTAVPVAELRRLWRAMGFADAGDDEAVFTDRDVEAVQLVLRVRERGIVDDEMQIAMTRALGQSLSRLAEWQATTLTVELVDRGVPPGSAQALDVSRELTPVLERLLVYVWRRHLAAAAGRVLVASPDELTARTATVGFADIVGFTTMSRHVDEHELGRVVERFEALAADIVAERHGRVVKTIGDEVLFVTDDPHEGADIGLSVAAQMDAEGLPRVRVGLGYGTVLARLGDVYGEVVNAASRLTSLARPGAVLIDDGLARALAGDPAYELKRLRPRSVRGIPRLSPTVLRRAAPQPG